MHLILNAVSETKRLKSICHKDRYPGENQTINLFVLEKVNEKNSKKCTNAGTGDRWEEIGERSTESFVFVRVIPEALNVCGKREEFIDKQLEETS